ncbi:MAG: hypothetical protein ABJQ29_02435 [Luteolibacter sp.]
MDPLNPWLDPAEVRHLAEQLLRPVAQSRLTANDAGFDESFVGFAATPRPQSAPYPEPPAPAQAPQQPAPPQEAPQQPAAPEPPHPSPPPAPPSRTRLLERVHIFRDWLAKNFEARDVFILDREGKVIFDESGHGRLHFMARNLAHASTGTGNIHVKIGPGSILEVIPSQTPYGRIVLGMLVPESLSQPHVKIIGEVLLQTASPA